MKDINLLIKDGGSYKSLLVPLYVVKDLLRDRLSKSEVSRLHRLAEPVQVDKGFEAGTVVVDFSTRQARCFQAELNVDDLEPSWEVVVENRTMTGY